MSIKATDRLHAILDGELSLDDVRALPPAHRRRLASLLHHWWMLAEGPKPEAARPSARNGEHASR